MKASGLLTGTLNLLTERTFFVIFKQVRKVDSLPYRLLNTFPGERVNAQVFASGFLLALFPYFFFQ